MATKVTDDTAGFLSAREVAASIALRKMADAIVTASTPRTPMDKGNLRRDVIKQVLGLHGEVRWDKDYAAVQEDVQHRNYTTPGTGPHFAENAVKAVVADAGSYFKQAGL